MRIRALAILFVFVNIGIAHANLKSADDKFLHGDYPEAGKQYKAVKGKDAPRAQLQLAKVQLRTGDYATAEKTLAPLAAGKDKPLSEDAQVLTAEVMRATGRYAEARKLLEATTKADPKHLRAREQLGLVYEETGEKDLAAAIWNSYMDDFNSGAIDQNTASAEDLMYVGVATRYTEDFEDSSDEFHDAVTKDPNLLEANLEWGWLFLDKYNPGDAGTSFDEVLKIDPNNPDANVGAARVKIESSYDTIAANAYVDKALAQNPKHPGALAIRAELLIDDALYDQAKKTASQILAVNPNDVNAHALIATADWLADDTAGYEAEKKKVFAVNPKYARFYHVVADFAVKEHRYPQAIALEEEALKVDPGYAVSLEAIGSGYLRMADEKNGLDYLNKAWDHDKFNVRTKNLLDLYEKVIATEYEFVTSKDFHFRMMKTERPMLERYVPRLMEKAFADMVKRYGFTPKLPVTVELFADPDNYSVRTVGLPNLGALGVCFGQVITALSPSNGNLNWGMVVWHELGHVFAIQLSNNRVPRWFTEGLSEYETIIARPEWRRENDIDVWMALDAGKLPSVVELNGKFMHARDMQEVVVAYHMSSVTIQFIAETYGFPKIVDALKLYGKGKNDTEVIKAISGLEPKAFDAKFQQYLRDGRLAPYKGTYKLRWAAFGDVTAFEKALAAKPNDAGALADVAVAYYVNEAPDKAIDAAQKALKLDPKNKQALTVVAEIPFQAGQLADAKTKLNDVIAAGGDGYEVRLRLGMIALKDNDLKEAATQLDLAKKLDPERSEPYSLLTDAYFKAGRDDDAIKELERYAMIEQMEYGPYKKLVDKFSTKKNWAKVKQYGEIGVMINPADGELHVELADADRETAKLDDAIYEYQSALLADPPLKRPALADLGLARTYLAKKDLKGARKAVADALKEEPKNAEALELKAKIK